MDEAMKQKADARLEASLAEASIRDPRELYRARMKHLRQRSPGAFETALRHYEETVVPRTAQDADPVAEWLAYGRLLAELDGPGRFMAVDGVGRARPWREGDAWAGMVVYLPDEKGGRPFTVCMPRDATAAQLATHALLVEGKRELDY
jgi:hypothetical protein